MSDGAEPTPPEQPTIYDSDLIVLAIARLERVAEKMRAREYDTELTEHMERATALFDWAAWNMAHRATHEGEPA